MTDLPVRELPRPIIGAAGDLLVYGNRPDGRSDTQATVRLTGLKLQTATMHLQGMTNREIAASLKRSEQWVSRTLRDPRVTTYIGVLVEDANQVISALSIKAVEKLRQALDSADPQTYMRAVEVQFKATGRFSDRTQTPATAEDVISRALALAHESVRVVGRRETNRLIDITADSIQVDE